MKRIYLDYAAATPLLPEVQEKMVQIFGMTGNPSSIHEEGRALAVMVKAARVEVAKALQTKPEQIVFTSGGTESCNLAIFGVARALKKVNPACNEVVISSVEHPAVSEPVSALEKEGFIVRVVPVDERGILRLEELQKVLSDKTAVVSVGHANSETGVVQNIREVAKLVREHASCSFLHSDASQSGMWVNLLSLTQYVDLLTLDASKMYGPKGAGLLWYRQGVVFEPVIFGGGQERGVRSGTENVVAIVGFAKALECAQKEREAIGGKVQELRDWFEGQILEKISDSKVNGKTNDKSAPRLPHISSMCFPGVTSEELVLRLDALGVAVAHASACSSLKDDPSASTTIAAMDEACASSSIRFSLGRETTREELGDVVEKLRALLKK